MTEESRQEKLAQRRSLEERGAPSVGGVAARPVLPSSAEGLPLSPWSTLNTAQRCAALRLGYVDESWDGALIALHLRAGTVTVPESPLLRKAAASPKASPKSPPPAARPPAAASPAELPSLSALSAPKPRQRRPKHKPTPAVAPPANYAALLKSAIAPRYDASVLLPPAASSPPPAASPGAASPPSLEHGLTPASARQWAAYLTSSPHTVRRPPRRSPVALEPLQPRQPPATATAGCAKHATLTASASAPPPLRAAAPLGCPAPGAMSSRGVMLDLYNRRALRAHGAQGPTPTGPARSKGGGAAPPWHGMAAPCSYTLCGRLPGSPDFDSFFAGGATVPRL